MKYQVLNCVVCQRTINLMKHGTHRWYKEGKLTGFTHLGKCTESKKMAIETNSPWRRSKAATFVSSGSIPSIAS